MLQDLKKNVIDNSGDIEKLMAGAGSNLLRSWVINMY